MREIKSVISTFKKYFNFWEVWCSEIYKKFGHLGLKDKESQSTTHETAQTEPSAAKRVYHFATSPEPRSPRPDHVKFRVGQVVRHKTYGFRGIIFGWDEETSAPPMWLLGKYRGNIEEVKGVPSYAILVDARHEEKKTLSYVNQNDLEVLTGIRVLNTEIDEYFESFDGDAYLPRPRLKKLYPDD